MTCSTLSPLLVHLRVPRTEFDNFERCANHSTCDRRHLTTQSYWRPTSLACSTGPVATAARVQRPLPASLGQHLGWALSAMLSYLREDGHVDGDSAVFCV